MWYSVQEKLEKSNKYTFKVYVQKYNEKKEGDNDIRLFA